MKQGSENPWKRWQHVIRYDTMREFNVDWKAECGQLNLAHVTRNKNGFYRLFHKVVFVATQLRCGGILSNHFITNFPQNVPVKKMKNGQYLAKIWTKVCGLLFWHNCKELTKTNASAQSGPSPRSVKTVQMEPKGLWRKRFVKQVSF